MVPWPDSNYGDDGDRLDWFFPFFFLDYDLGIFCLCRVASPDYDCGSGCDFCYVYLTSDDDAFLHFDCFCVVFVFLAVGTPFLEIPWVKEVEDNCRDLLATLEAVVEEQIRVASHSRNQVESRDTRTYLVGNLGNIGLDLVVEAEEHWLAVVGGEGAAVTPPDSLGVAVEGLVDVEVH